MQERIINFDLEAERRKVVAGICKMRGRWRLAFARFRPRRSDRQNAFYWGGMVTPITDFLRENGTIVSNEDTHEFLKQRFLRVPIAHPRTGELMGHTVRSTTSLTTTEFNQFLDAVADLMFHHCDLPKPDPEDYRAKARRDKCTSSMA